MRRAPRITSRPLRRSLAARARTANLAGYATLWVIAVAFIVPLVWMLLTSLKPDSEIYSLPLTFFPNSASLAHYRHIFEKMPNVFVYLRNSTIVGVASVSLVATVSIMAGYSFGCIRYRGREVLFVFFIFILAVPHVAFLIPVYIMFSRLRILNTLWGLIFPYAALNLPLAIVIMRGTFRAIPAELESAARIDGCGGLRILWNIMLPLAKAGLASALIFTFLAAWEEFLFAATIMSKTANTTVSVGINFLKEEAQSWAFGTLSAAVVLTALPGLVIFTLGRRYYVSAFLEGALKG